MPNIFQLSSEFMKNQRKREENQLRALFLISHYCHKYYTYSIYINCVQVYLLILLQDMRYLIPVLFNPLTPESDQHLIFLYNITPKSHIKVMRIKEMPLPNLVIWAICGPSMEMVWHNKLWPIYGQHMALVWAIDSISKPYMPLSSFSFDSIVFNYGIATYLAQFHRIPIVCMVTNWRSSGLSNKFSLSAPYGIYGEQYGEYAY